MKILLKTCLVVSMAFGAVSCGEDFLDQDGPHIITAENLFTSIDGFDNALNGLYAQVRRERGGATFGSSNGLLITPALGGTDIIYANRPTGSERFLNDWGDVINPGTTHTRRVFNWLYEVIGTANTIINRAEEAPGDIPEDELNRAVAEARTIRAWAYRHLTFLYGDVPLILEEANGSNIRTDWERTPVATIRMRMQEDLEFGVQFLPENFINDGKIIRAVAQHYLAELHLTNDDLDAAISVAEAAIDGPRSLITSRYGVASGQPGAVFTDMFLDGNSNPSEGNTEALWVFQNELDVNGGNGHNIMRRWLMSEYSSTSGGAPGLAVTVERGGRGQTRLSATSFMLNLYDTNVEGDIIDDRGGHFAWRRFFTYIEEDPIPDGKVVGDTIFLDDSETDPLGNRFWPYTRKWDYAFDADPRTSRSFNDQVYLRLADTYLLLAEAYFKNDELARAAQMINDLRMRANAPLIAEGDIDLDFILDERARELFSEEHRRYTLLRTNKWLERTRAHNTVAGPNIQDFNRLFPIPQDFIDTNIDNEIQNNPGY